MIDGVRVFRTGWGNLDALGAVGMMWFSVPILMSVYTSSSRHLLYLIVKRFSQLFCSIILQLANSSLVNQLNERRWDTHDRLLVESGTYVGDLIGSLRTSKIADAEP